ncbi:MAG: 3-methyl-2-oxobutanoate hydroxymethyltransferase [Dehalococcoidia bacterium]|jgi:3-methyl-2-oxobutanoate hydroxymethyltransferase|nr:3-methyl-2-oxobutanoate hydroxymethyltransferase [Dehalococcoidia bacterium]MDP7469539.1 3-methyl-2-oxobutanoate hydroxymethyltransferase [Dehalococcoidia bacterium]
MRVSIGQVKEMKEKREKIVELTAYEYATAKLVDEVGVPIILVGDSLGMVLLGYESTIPVTIDEMLHHCKAVTRGVKNALVVGDMPFMTYHTSAEDALRNAGRFIQEAGCQAVKLEGGVTVAEKIRRIVESGIPVQGHIGLTPQSVNQLGGYRVQGRTPEAALKLYQDAKAVEEAGAFSIVLETVPADLSAFISRKLSIPTIGIGAGVECDGQVQVIHDILGLFSAFLPKHAKRYVNLGEAINKAVSQYFEEVRAGQFPTEENSFAMDAEVVAELNRIVG